MELRSGKRFERSYEISENNRIKKACVFKTVREKIVEVISNGESLSQEKMDEMIDTVIHRSSFITGKRLHALVAILTKSMPKECPEWVSVDIWNQLLLKKQSKTLVTFKFDARRAILTIQIPDVYDAIIQSRLTYGRALSKASHVNSRYEWWRISNLGEFCVPINSPIHRGHIEHLGMELCEKSIVIPRSLMEIERFRDVLRLAIEGHPRWLTGVLKRIFWETEKEYLTAASIEIIDRGEPYHQYPPIEHLKPFDTALRNAIAKCFPEVKSDQESE